MAKNSKSKKTALPVAGPETACAPISATKKHEMNAQEKLWRAQEDLRTMQRAKEIQKDKSRMQGMKTLAKEQINTLKTVV